MDTLTFIYNGAEGGSIVCVYGSEENSTSPVQMVDLSPGDSIVLDVPDGTSTMTCSALDGNGYPVVPAIEINASCDGERNLVLMQEYGGSDTTDAVLTFVGYVCRASTINEIPETHFCIIEVEYAIEICNTGAGSETITDVTLTVTENGVPNTHVSTENPPVGAVLGLPGSDTECLTVPYTGSVDVCTETIYSVTTEVHMVAPPNTQEPCVETVTIDYKTSENTLSPTQAQTEQPSPIPSASPSASPSKMPTQSPTEVPTKAPTPQLTLPPTLSPSSIPSYSPTGFPTVATVTQAPTTSSSAAPSAAPSPSTNSPSSDPSSAPTPCPIDPCIDLGEETIPDDGCDPCVPIIKLKDSWCGKEWDKWCVALYAKCCPQAGCPASAIEAVQMPDECPEELQGTLENGAEGAEYSEFRTPWRTAPAP
jgi:hypothetical protein